MAHIVGRSERASRGQRGGRTLLAIPVGLCALAIVALGYVVYVLWPRWPEPAVEPDAPPLPIVVAGVAFNVAPAAVRIALQRRPGTQERVDLAYLWPSLTPPDMSGKSGPAARPGDRIFVTIVASDGTLPPAERLKAIYPRYTDANASVGPGGLTLLPFRAGTPYSGEDLLFDPVAPERSLLRCSHDGRGAMPDTCLHERRIGAADVTLRFPRAWLADWPGVLAGIEKLITGLHAQSSGG